MKRCPKDIRLTRIMINQKVGFCEYVVCDSVLRDVVRFDAQLEQRVQDEEWVHKGVRKKHEDRKDLSPETADKRNLHSS